MVWGSAQVDGSNVRQAPEEEQLYRGVHAPMRKAVADEPTMTEMPKVRLQDRGPLDTLSLPRGSIPNPAATLSLLWGAARVLATSMLSLTLPCQCGSRAKPCKSFSRAVPTYRIPDSSAFTSESGMNWEKRRCATW